jgi:hypothetical protein
MAALQLMRIALARAILKNGLSVKRVAESPSSLENTTSFGVGCGRRRAEAK